MEFLLLITNILLVLILCTLIPIYMSVDKIRQNQFDALNKDK